MGQLVNNWAVHHGCVHMPRVALLLSSLHIIGGIKFYIPALSPLALLPQILPRPLDITLLLGLQIFIAAAALF